MEPAITKERLLDALRSERARFVDLLAGLSDEEWRKSSQCEAWSVAQLAAHVVVSGDYLPWDLPWFLLTGRSGDQWMEHKIAGVLREGPAGVVEALRQREIPLTARVLGSMGRMVEYGEALVHQEDVRRPLGRPRTAPPAPEATWALVGFYASQFQLKRLSSGGVVQIEAADGRTAVYQVGGRAKPKRLKSAASPDAIVRGEPLELALFLTGRPANAAIIGASPLAEELRTASLRFSPLG